MLATYGEKFIQVTTICVLLPYTIRCLSQNRTYIPLSEKRSLNNYIATSVPYTVENQSSNQDEASHEKVDTALITPEGSSQDVLDCLNENHCVNNITSSEPSSSEGTFKPYSQDELNKILQKYQGGEKDTIEAQETSNKVANYYSVASSNNIESSSQGTTDSHDKSKAWNVVNYSQNYNKNPYDDRMGWVTLEPIAWSSSQVQKWEPNQKPMWPLPPQGNGPWGPQPQYQQQQQPAYGGYSERPYKKPTYQYQNNKPWSANQNYQKPQYQDNFGNQEIITDGQPGYFPAERPSSTGGYKPWVEQTQSISYIDSANRPSTHVVYQGIGTGTHPHHIPERPAPVSTSSAEGDGHWVLLSSTKGYSVPHRQRSLGRSLEPDDKTNTLDNKDEKADKSYRPLSARRSIRLTVLPSLNGPGSTVTSHNGMIEVESTHQTVDEAHREHLARMMRFGNETSNQVSPPGSSFRAVAGKVEAVPRPATRRNTILAAVGAGMIPATMAMLLPMLLGRRKRSVVQPQIVTLNLRKYSKPAVITKYQKKPTNDVLKKKLVSGVEFY